MAEEVDDINALPFNSRRAPQPQLEAVLALAEKRGQKIEEFDQYTMGEVVKIAQETYGKKLPDYWKVWIDWQLNAHRQEMGDL